MNNVLLVLNIMMDQKDMISPDTNLPEWLEAKITLAAEYLNKAKDYLSNYDASRMGVNLNEQGFDDRLANAMGMSDDEFEDEIASRDIGDGGSPFPGTNNVSPFAAKAKDYIEKFRQEYRDMSDDGIDEFSKTIIDHLLDNTAAQAAAKMYFAKKGL